MRRCFAAFALIRRTTDAGPLWLAQWNRKWQAFNLVGGHREQDETSWECVVREVEEELGLRRDIDFVVHPQPTPRIEFEAWSVPLGETTMYEMEVFPATLIPETIADMLLGAGDNRWLAMGEIEAGITADGRRISEVTTRFFRAAT